MQLRPDGLLGHGGRYGRAARTRQIEEGRRAAAPVAAEPLTDGLGAAAQARGSLREGTCSLDHSTIQARIETRPTAWRVRSARA
jgi:hypothetical protein